jgi:phosphate uptake regulator
MISTAVIHQFMLIEELIDNGWQDSIYQKIAENEDIIDSIETDVMKKLPIIVALLAPKAGGLREVIASHETVLFLENIGDLLLDMAHHLQTIDFSIPDYEEFKSDFKKIVHLLKTIVNTVTFAFLQGDKLPAYSILGKEDEIEKLSQELSGNLVAVFQEIPLSGQEIQNIMNLNAMAFIMEKIKNIAINIAKSIIFAKEGTDMRHLRFEK